MKTAILVEGTQSRRITLSECTFKALQIEANLGPSSQVKYVDEDKDLLTVSSTPELAEAFRFAEERAQPLQLLISGVSCHDPLVTISDTTLETDEEEAEDEEIEEATQAVEAILAAREVPVVVVAKATVEKTTPTPQASTTSAQATSVPTPQATSVPTPQATPMPTQATPPPSDLKSLGLKLLAIVESATVQTAEQLQTAGVCAASLLSEGASVEDIVRGLRVTLDGVVWAPEVIQLLESSSASLQPFVDKIHGTGCEMSGTLLSQMDSILAIVLAPPALVQLKKLVPMAREYLQQGCFRFCEQACRQLPQDFDWTAFAPLLSLFSSFGPLMAAFSPLMGEYGLPSLFSMAFNSPRNRSDESPADPRRPENPWAACENPWAGAPGCGPQHSPFMGAAGLPAWFSMAFNSPGDSPSDHRRPENPWAACETPWANPCTGTKPKRAQIDQLPLRIGSTGPSVARLQNLLNQAGLPASVDGFFGPQTRDAVLRFQSSQNLQVDGVVGPLTAHALALASTQANPPTKASTNNKTTARIDGVHQGVKCDGCGLFPIAGARFSCLVCPDFDLCQTCEATQAHPQEHPLLKMWPKTEAQQSNNVIHQGVTCNGCGVDPVTGPLYKCSMCRDFNLCSDCEAKVPAVHPLEHSFLKIRAPRL